MDASRFDAVLRALAGGTSRRGLIGGAAAVAAGLLGVGGVAAACPPGQVSKRGRCLCKKTGRPPVAGSCPCPKGQTDTGDGLGCLECRADNDCAAPDTCGGGGAPNVCGCSGARNGQPCEANEECCSGICQAFTCVATIAGTCPAGADICADGTFCGNGACGCFLTPTGASICSDGGGVCANCATDDDCETGLHCVVLSGGCGCGGIDFTACLTPCAPQATSCFVAGTRVAMADGTSRSIEEIAVGDEVLGREGRANRVVKIKRPRLGNRLLYALNDGAFFVTAEHPFLTEAGWKAIDPAATAAENPALQVGVLAVGDRLLALAGVAVPAGAGRWSDDEPVNVHLESVPLRGIVGRPADPATTVYNLRLDGDHAYFADDLLVHNK